MGVRILYRQRPEKVITSAAYGNYPWGAPGEFERSIKRRGRNKDLRPSKESLSQPETCLRTHRVELKQGN